MEMSKKVLIDELSTEVRKQIQIVREHYIPASAEKLNSPSEDGGWSILQCLEHLNSYGVYYLPAIAAALDRAENRSGEMYKGGWLGNYFTKIMSPETGTKKYKAMKGHLPAIDLDSASVLNDFLHQAELLLVYLEAARRIDIGSVRVPLSLAKWIRLKLGDIFRFLIAHNNRHVLQAERNFTGKSIR